MVVFNPGMSGGRFHPGSDEPFEEVRFVPTFFLSCNNAIMEAVLPGSVAEKMPSVPREPADPKRLPSPDEGE